jgi:Uma2 family endonuclease
VPRALAHELYEYLERNPVGVMYISPSDIELEPEHIVQPDVFVLPMQEARRTLHAWPARELLVAVEVLSPSSGRGDKVTKRLLYGRHVPEYWIVDLDARIVERWRQHAEQPQAIVTALEWQPPGAAESFGLDLARFFAAVFMEQAPGNG